MAVLDGISPNRPPGSKTLKELMQEAEAIGIKYSRTQFAKKLEKMAKAGAIKITKGVFDGQVCNLYSEP